ncbi:CocE/NonD family hydrolase [uncultured Sphingomonas sp.]|uniref:CocE/NonD family hydrolase n=1 Tax=uncultured Sphingomonas sp. TaxID=158754 RepID=UPI0035CBE669
MLLKGVFAGPVVGLRYQTPSCSGVTDDKGQFSYRAGERIAFLVGDVPVGHTMGAERVNMAQLVSRVDGNIQKLLDPGLTNVARFLCSLDRDGDLDGGIEIAPEVHAIVGSRPINFRRDVSFAGVYADHVGDFERDPLILKVLADLDQDGAFTGNKPRRLCSAATARNEVRRNILGIRRFRDVKVPLQNGSYVYADVFRPDRNGQFPVVMSCGVYGRAFHHHTVCNDADFERHEEEEERYFQGNPEGLIFENHESVNTADWVPHDYVVVRVDGPGTGKNPGKLAVWGHSTAEAYRDAIDWAGVQSWCNGNVGLWGLSYLAMTQHQAASLKPAHLKALIAIGTDVDMYEEVVYTGGILNEEFFPFWFKAGAARAVCGEPDAVDFMSIVRNAPFKDSNPAAVFGPTSEVFMSPDMSGVDLPLWTVAVTAHPSHLHQLGSSEAYLTTNTTNKKIDFWEDWFTKSYSAQSVAEHRAFFDHWLKGIDNGIMSSPPVRLEIRAGNGSYYLQEENEWPVARTRYTRWYLDASPSDWSGDPWRDDFYRLSPDEPGAARQVDYPAEVAAEIRTGPPAALLPVEAGATALHWRTGISFISDPMPQDMVLAGYSKARLWVSSTSRDMDLFLSLRILDEHDREVDYVGPATLGFPTRQYPLAKGWLKVSHRKIDPVRSTDYTVKHTHLQADYAPLAADEVVPVEVEIIPTAAMIRKGHRIRLDVQPFDGYAHGARHQCDPSYHDGARNTIYTGPDRLSWVQLPIVPARSV